MPVRLAKFESTWLTKGLGFPIASPAQEVHRSISMERPIKSLFKGLLYFGSEGGRPMLEAALTIDGATSAEAARKESSIVGKVWVLRDVWKDEVDDELLGNSSRGQVNIYSPELVAGNSQGSSGPDPGQTILFKNPPASCRLPAVRTDPSDIARAIPGEARDV